MITYRNYLDKAYGCWLGKCIAGTIGAPFEGMKQEIDFKFSPKLLEKMLPNDDLDLQVLWLSVLEQKGVNFTADDLAAAFSQYNINWPGEYAAFKKNYDRGINPPYTAHFENSFYNEGMGCPIRAEIWGLIFPCNPAFAAKVCVADGTLDHVGNSVYFEQFWAAIIAKCFEVSDYRALIAEGLQYIPKNSRAYALICDTVRWVDEYGSLKEVFRRVLQRYGHCDCTNSFQNIAITLAAVLLNGGDFIKTVTEAVRCGFDTDCTAGNAGALIGAVLGAEKLRELYGIGEAEFVLSLYYKRESNKVFELARDTARVAKHFLENTPGAIDCIRDLPADFKKLDIAVKKPDFSVLFCYDNGPYIGSRDTLTLFAEIETEGRTALEVECPAGFTAKYPMSVNGSIRVAIIVSSDVEMLHETNLFTLKLQGRKGGFQKKFGLVGKIPWRVFGPYWKNNYHLSPAEGQSYGELIAGRDYQDYLDKLRFYHLNTLAQGANAETLKLVERDADLYEDIELCGDIFTYADYARFRGASTYYLKRILCFDEDTTLSINLGCSDGCALWLNGEQLIETQGCENWNLENRHLLECHFRKGENILIFRTDRTGVEAKYSIIFNNKGFMTHIYTNTKSKKGVDS